MNTNSGTDQDLKSAAQRIAFLKSEIRRHQQLYYRQASPAISDREYDRLFDELLELEERFPELKTADSPTQGIGSDLDNRFEEKPLPVTLLSLDKVYSQEEMLEWMLKLEGREQVSFVAEQKIDGTSILLHYEEGKLQTAFTRGNGAVGNVVTENIKTISRIPQAVKYRKPFAVRGEIYIEKQDFAELNKRFDERFANPRNLAAGTLRSIRPGAVSRIPLRIFVYDLFLLQEKQPDHLEGLKLMEELRFPTHGEIAYFSRDSEKLERFRHGFPERSAFATEAISEWIENQGRIRNELPYEIDGLVVKINEQEARQALGSTTHHPRFTMAYKFEAPVAQTVVRSIQVQVGRNGRVTPVALLDPVKIAGSTVSRATLHNQDYIAILELNREDLVAVSKRGDIIPAVEKVVEKRSRAEPYFRLPPDCPFCSGPLLKEGAHHFCTNTQCPERKRRELIHFCSKNGLDIEGLGEKTVELLFNKGLVKEIPDLFLLDYNQLLSFEGFGPKKIANIRENLEKSKRQGFDRVLLALGVEGLGETGIRRLLKAGYDSLEKLLAIAGRNDHDKLAEIDGIGPQTSESLIRRLNEPGFRNVAATLAKIGLQFQSTGNTNLPGKEPSGIFSGQNWAITGSFRNFQPREQAAAEIAKRGGEVSEAITKKTTHLLLGEKPGSKLVKARSLGVTIVTEDNFLEMLAAGKQ